MKLFTAAALAASFLIGMVDAECSVVEVPLESATRLSFAGFLPNIERITNSGVGNKVIFKGFSKTPIVGMDDGVLTVSAGENCASDDTLDPPDNPDGEATSSAAKAVNFLGIALSFLSGQSAGTSIVSAGAFAFAFSLLEFSQPVLADGTVSECDLDPIEVEIYVDTTADEIVMREAKSGDFEVCPPESLYWKHHPDVYAGYEGCVGEKGYYPCAQDSQGVWEEGGALAAKYPLVWDGSSCVETGYGFENRTFWILWGDPLDKFELNARTGFNPVVSFPFNRGPYPRYENGVNVEEAIDDSADARAMAKDLLVYIGAFEKAELEAWDVTMTEGAESGMAYLYAAKALEIAQTTCNRDIYVLSEVPAYGYSNGDAADIVNKNADSFYEGPECMCFNTTDGCKAPTVTISTRGWLPLTDLPIEMGGDGLMYAADSAATASPWFESMVFPENPSGAIKTPQHPDPNRRVCDGVYVWPMYFGMRDYKIPIDERPDCASWSFSITKAYSASVRAGFVLYKEDPVSSHDAVVSVVGDMFSMTNGLYSEWSWYGQMQLWEMIMSRSLEDPTSWVGAYTEIMDEKWEAIIEGFAGCPVMEVTNPKAGAYVWFRYLPPYTGIQTGFVSSFFRDVLGIRTTTYNWGFRGANPADFYGDDYSTTDFTRLQLYRDKTIYEEVARRAKIVCADPDATIGDFISVNQWAAGEGDTARRRMDEGYASPEERKLHYQQIFPDVTERQLEYLVPSHEETDGLDRNAAACAPAYTTTCLFDAVGTRHSDI